MDFVTTKGIIVSQRFDLQIAEIQQELENKGTAVQENDERMAEYEREKNEAEKRCLKIEKEKNKTRKQLSAFCAKKRNEYSNIQIKKDFKAGLRVGHLCIPIGFNLITNLWKC